ncbi:hypothetical protein AgCh_026064 [Apium graveolens]
MSFSRKYAERKSESEVKTILMLKSISIVSRGLLGRQILTDGTQDTTETKNEVKGQKNGASARKAGRPHQRNSECACPRGGGAAAPEIVLNVDPNFWKSGADEVKSFIYDVSHYDHGHSYSPSLVVLEGGASSWPGGERSRTIDGERSRTTNRGGNI